MDGKTLTDDKDIVDGIYNYFCPKGSKISSKINNIFLYLQWKKQKSVAS